MNAWYTISSQCYYPMGWLMGWLLEYKWWIDMYNGDEWWNGMMNGWFMDDEWWFMVRKLMIYGW